MTAKSSDWRPGPSVCRCCFAEGCYKDISTEYFWMGKREVYQEMLSTTFDVSISYAQSGGPNSNSRLICEPCIARLRDASDFKRQVQECERVFHQHLDPTSSVSELEAVVVEPPGKEVKLERVKVESKLSDDEDFDDHAFVDDDDDDLDDQPLTALATKVPKKESVDLMDLLDNAKPEKRKAAAKPKTPPAKKAKKKESPKPSASKPAPKPVEKKRKGDETSKRDDGPETAKKTASTDEPAKNSKEISKIRKLSASQLIINSNICPFRWAKTLFTCLYCKASFTTIELLKDHNKSHESIAEDVVLKACSKWVTSHEQVKVNVTNVRCKLCDDNITNFEDLKHHLVDKHDKKQIDVKNDGLLPFKIENEHYVCAVCDKEFAEYKILNQHMNIHYKNFICDLCGSGFMTPLRLKIHTRTHETGAHPCSVCSKIFRTVSARNDHYAVVHMNAKRSKCPHCFETFKTYYQKKKHLVKVHALKVSEFKCNLCPQTYLLSADLNVHKRQIHFNEKRYACDVCDWKFYQKCQLRDHMVSHGVGAKTHECQICKKTYLRRRTLRKHILSVHEKHKN
ncbi:zinc finger protein 567-like isoform X16 [Pectinophora gossypiella]|uniref:zinc finger protein 567-like isoform X16 n=1 Tax=Pectinophora gossypiella TaxID=13191 RepID=UPI00214EF608|nr:zinc finger protein 567-like isoform X16 [Pectinophora gossypiella]